MSYSKYVFSGHESFPCKSLWLKKGYDFILAEKDFNTPEAVVELGVGKNMVAAIRYWYKAFGLNSDDERIKWIPDFLFNDQDGKDRYMEDLGTLWLLHFLLVYSNIASLYNLFFIDFQKERRRFDRNQIVTFVKRKMGEANQDHLFNINTVKKDVGVLLQNYCLPRNPQSNEDYSTLLMDLDLLRQKEKKEENVENEKDKSFYFNIEGKKKVTPEVFLFAVLMYKPDEDNTIPFDLLQDVGLIFCMNDLEVIEMLRALSEQYSDYMTYSDVAGIRQLQFVQQVNPRQIIEQYYEQ
jgi:hypothetical protein